MGKRKKRTHAQFYVGLPDNTWYIETVEVPHVTEGNLMLLGDQIWEEARKKLHARLTRSGVKPVFLGRCHMSTEA